ncbi:hypothetical protein [Candidatus Nanopusillus massiliensis]|uniref:hypothetical protein n=1 Tax=Candidatus Nanopusillus massiliensis TaxID=2897163 RepID=UPI001E53E2DD|nr:hypothetical protein [Candidatus Nanopusillus massiliensis]
MKKGRAESSGGGLIFLLILIILIIVAYLYRNQILAYMENNEMFQSVENGIVQFINDAQQAFNIIQTALNENVSLNNLYTSNNQNNSYTSG